MELAFLSFSFLQEYLDSGEHFKDNITNELILFVVFLFVELVHFGGQNFEYFCNFDFWNQVHTEFSEKTDSFIGHYFRIPINLSLKGLVQDIGQI